MSRARLVLCVVLAIALLVVGGLAIAGPRRNDRGPVDSITGGGYFSPGPRPPVAGVQTQPSAEEKVHINIRIVCGEGNQHLRIHSNLFEFEADDDTIEADCFDFDDDDGNVSGSASGICNGAPAELTSYSFSDNVGFFDGGGPVVGGKGPVGDTAFITLEGEGACSISDGDTIKGSFQYHNGTAPATTPPPLAL